MRSEYPFLKLPEIDPMKDLLFSGFPANEPEAKYT